MKNQLNTLMNAVEATAPYNLQVPALQRRAFHIACIDLGEFLERSRKRAFWSATKAANMLGVTLPHYRDMEKGNRRFLPIHVKALMKCPDFKKAVTSAPLARRSA